MKPLKPPSETPPRTKKTPAAKPRPAAEILDFVQYRIESHPMVLGEGLEVRKDRLGYSLYLTEEDEPVARLRPLDKRQRFELLYWCYAKNAWRRVDSRRATIMPLDEALDFIDDDPLACFWL